MKYDADSTDYEAILSTGKRGLGGRPVAGLQEGLIMEELPMINAPFMGYGEGLSWPGEWNDWEEGLQKVQKVVWQESRREIRQENRQEIQQVGWREIRRENQQEIRQESRWEIRQVGRGEPRQQGFQAGARERQRLEQENEGLRRELEELKRQVKDRGREPGR
ncbi:MAG: hypothetical protein LBP88_03190 [Treponema sp.]|nr:hypothetical protein [Treponema sp.]